MPEPEPLDLADRRPRLGLGIGLVLAGIGWFAAMLGAIMFFWKRPTSPIEDEASGRGSASTPPSAQAQSSGHETEDMSGGTMMWVMIALGGVIAGSVVLMILLLGYFHQQRRDGAPPFTAEQTRTLQAPKPNLQIDPGGDLTRLHQAERALLDHYAWVDRGHTAARIPISRAATLMIGRTLDPAP